VVRDQFDESIERVVKIGSTLKLLTLKRRLGRKALELEM
jgi:hypothetical protein